MNCREVRCYFENPLLIEISSSAGASNLSQHIRKCPDCNRYMEAQKELAVSLRLAHQSVPPFPASLDRTVVSNYRHYISQRKATTQGTRRTKRLRPLSVLGWAAALAASVLIAREEMVLLFPGNSAMVSSRLDSRPTASPPQSPSMRITTQNAMENKPQKEQTVASVRKRPLKTPSRRQPDLFSPVFASLLYCDPLSCDGAMEIVRVELPSSVLRSAQPSTEANMLSADVLVGPDGIARAIRIVQ